MWIDVEGGEGVGKTAIIEGIKSEYEKQGWHVAVLRGLGSLKYGAIVREDLLAKKLEGDPLQAAAVFLAHIEVLSEIKRLHKIAKESKEKLLIITDRSLPTFISINGQGFNNTFVFPLVKALLGYVALQAESETADEFDLKFCFPDKIFLIKRDLDRVKESMVSREDINFFDVLEDDHRKLIDNSYLGSCKVFTEQPIVIHNNGTLYSAVAECCGHIDNLIS